MQTTAEQERADEPSDPRGFGRVAIWLVRGYQRGISPLLGPCCRYQPTCSEYMIGAIRKHGAVRGIARGVARILRCHPWCRGGYDPP